MTELFLTAYDGSILGPVAKVLGWFMDKIYIFLTNVCHVESIALTICVFTVFIYLVLFPLTYQQQKFSVLTRKMQPEMNAIRSKYEGKKDQSSQMAMNEEMQALYDKYGISQMGSCLYLIIQMPILLALYRVFYNVPAYISSVKNIFTDLVSGIVATDGFADKMTTIYTDAKLRSVAVDFTSTDISAVKNFCIDVIYKLPASGWDALKASFPELSSTIDVAFNKLESINYLFVLNISDTPMNFIKSGWADKNFVILICALLIPVLSYLTQVLNIKMTPQSTEGQSDQMAQQMKTMNLMMPLMSLFIAFSVPVGLALYWIAGALVRTVQQFFLNRHFDKIDLDSIIEKNKEKAKEKAEKRGIRQAQIYEAANMKTKQSSMASKANFSAEKIDALNKAEEYRANANKNSLAAKANLVKEFNERNNK